MDIMVNSAANKSDAESSLDTTIIDGSNQAGMGSYTRFITVELHQRHLKAASAAVLY